MSHHQSLSPGDIDHIREKNISLETIEVQLENFRNGFPPISLVAPAIEGNGIIRLSREECMTYAGKYKNIQGKLHSVKFIPASGAASRMFKSLFEYLNEEEGISGEGNVDPVVTEFVGGLDKLALTEDLKESLRKGGKDLWELVAGGEFKEIIRRVLVGNGLNYGQLPKGLIKFHKYPDECRTPAEEHLVEGAEYCQGAGGLVNLHLTVSPEHLDLFIDHINQKQSQYEKRFGVRYNIEFSLQRSFTDTIAVDLQNQPFRDTDGSILFRPGGHGALLTNLNEIDADLIFIKNIDNVCPDHMKPTTYLYKKALAGILLEYQQKAFQYLKLLDSDKAFSPDEIEDFLENQLGLRLSEPDKDLKGDGKVDLLKQKLNRPIRVCGMVRNEGEPGGGPFWARNQDGSVSLQIVESSQINFDDPVQSGMVDNATHFNPVDLVCATRDYKGNSYNLNKFTDPSTGMISGKSRDGKSLKAQELPGLWNGAMSDWNTLFIEVPLETFNPVKTINDLLRPEHLA
ncbi:DUF4301 family protein [Bacteroidota bacterium]